MAVVGALDLQQQVAARGAAGEVDAVERRLGAGVGEAPVREAEAVAQRLGDDDRALGGGGEVRALVHARLHGGGDGRVGVADAHDAEAVVEVDVLVAVDVPDLRADAALEVDGPGLARLERRRNAAGHDQAGALVVLLRAARAREEALALTLGELGDPASIDVCDVLRLDGHASSGRVIQRSEGPRREPVRHAGHRHPS